MTQTEKNQWSLKYLLELFSIIAIFGSIFASYKLQDYRTGAVENRVTDHIEVDDARTEKTDDKLDLVNVNQRVIMSDVSRIQKDVEKIAEKIDSMESYN